MPTTVNLATDGGQHVIPRARKQRMPEWATRIDNADKGMNVVRMEMYNYDLRQLSIRVGVSYSCLSAIRCGRTKWPRPDTLFPLIELLGINMYFAKRDDQMRALRPKHSIAIGEDQAEYETLYAVANTIDGVDALTTAWQPSNEDLAILNSGGCVYLVVQGGAHPPVILACAGAPTLHEDEDG